MTAQVPTDFPVPSDVTGFWQWDKLHAPRPLPPLDQEPRPYFARLRELRERLRSVHEGLGELSMGMSADYEEAVEEGATMVRVGTAIFGPRPGAVRGEPRAGKP